ncbi:MAG: ACT domain-containing protein, partial [Thaumarchaeota archaeon]|nr:ACT domain-containing protein [Nitrososphaerota archaeon]
ESLEKAARLVKNTVERGFNVTVVVSAFKGMTDMLIQQSKTLDPAIPDSVIDEVLSLGEKTSARIFANKLHTMGLEPVVIDPDSPRWPIMTDSKHLNATPILSETTRRVRKSLEPLLKEGKIPIVCGFLGKDALGKTTTLGRGGSDTTAVLLGNCLKANEVVLVKDVDTVLSGDPDTVDGTVPVGTLNVEEAYTLSSGGAKFLQPKALRYLDKGVRIRIASLEESILSGTIIEGGPIDLRLEILKEPVSMITILTGTQPIPQQVAELMSVIRESANRLIAMTLDERSILLYAVGGNGLLNRIHKLAVGTGWAKAVSSYEDLTMLTVKGQAMETSPGMLQRITQPLARRGINVYGVSTITSSISVFVASSDAEKAASMLRDALMIRPE